MKEDYYVFFYFERGDTFPKKQRWYSLENLCLYHRLPFEEVKRKMNGLTGSYSTKKNIAGFFMECGVEKACFMEASPKVKLILEELKKK